MNPTKPETRRMLGLVAIGALFLCVVGCLVAVGFQRVFQMSTGDSFTAVGALFSGCSFVGVVVAVWAFQLQRTALEDQMKAVGDQQKAASQEHKNSLFAAVLCARIQATTALLQFRDEQLKTRRDEELLRMREHLADELERLKRTACHGPAAWKWEDINLH